MPAAANLAVGSAAAALAVELVGPGPVLLGGLALLLGSVAARGRRRTAALALGMILIGLRGIAAPAAVIGPTTLPPGDGPWSAVVVSVGSPKDGTRPAVIQLEAPTAITVAATLPWYPAVVPGDRIEATGAIRPPPATDYAAYLTRVGAVGTLRAGSLALLPPSAGFGRWLEGLRRGAAAAIARAIPEPEAGLAAGILIGLRDLVDRDLAAAFTTAGASHVVAISGWNIAIVATSLGAIAGGIGRRRRSVLTGLGIALYVLFVGPSPSVVRAGAMAGIALLARELGRPSRAAAAMGLAVAGLLVIEPAWIDDPGFRLSVLATAGLMAWGTPLAKRLAGPSPNRLRAWFAESLGVSLAAQAATLPVILLEFGRLSLVAPLVNIGVVPLVAPAMGAGALALLAGLGTGLGLPGFIATIGGLPAWVLLGAIVAMVRAGAAMPLASLSLDPPWDVVAAAVSAVAILAIARFGGRLGPSEPPPKLPRSRPVSTTKSSTTSATPGRVPQRRSRAERVAVTALAAAIIAMALALSHRPDGTTRVIVLDVGQGDAILVEGSQGGRMLVDGGPDPGRLLIALDERLPAWDHRIDILVLTHPHEDHAAGLATLLGRYRVGRIYEPGMIGPGPGYVALAAALATGGPPHGTLSTGDRLALDDINFRVLWPDPGRVPLHPADGGTAINNVSIVLLGEVGGHRFLLAGDIEQEVDPELLARGLPQVDFLKVAHHGSRTSSTEAFLEAVRPRVAAVSAGLGNPYGHPAPATIDRLKAIARETYRTDRDGTIEVQFAGDVLHVRTSGPRRTSTTIGSPLAVTAGPSTKIPPATSGGTVLPSRQPLAFLCAISSPSDARPTLPTVAEAPRSPTNDPRWRDGIGGSVPANEVAAVVAARSAAAPGWRLARLPEPGAGPPGARLYHRQDDRPGAAGTVGLLLGRRRLRARGGRRGLPDRSGAFSGRDPGPLAPPDRSRPGWPSPLGADRAPFHRIALRGWDPRDRGRGGRAGPAQPGP